MKMKFREEAQKDLQQIVEYYEKEADISVADSFVLELESIFNKLYKLPEMGRKILFKKNNLKVRVFIVGKFPYLIIYSYSKKQGSLEIVRIINTHTDFKNKLLQYLI